MFVRGGTVVRSAADCNLKLRNEAQTVRFRSSTPVLSVGFSLSKQMLHQISLYMDEQWEMCAVIPWPPLKDSQCLPPWLMFSVCSYGCSWAYASGFFVFVVVFFWFFCLSLRILAVTDLGLLFRIWKGPQNINLVWSLLNLNYIFQNSSYQVISLGGLGGGWDLAIDARTRREWIWLFSSTAYLMPCGSACQQSVCSEEI